MGMNELRPMPMAMAMSMPQRHVAGGKWVAAEEKHGLPTGA